MVNYILQEKRRKEEEAEAQLDMQLAQEATHAKMAKDLSIEVVKCSGPFYVVKCFILTKKRFNKFTNFHPRCF